MNLINFKDFTSKYFISHNGVFLYLLTPEYRRIIVVSKEDLTRELTKFGYVHGIKLIESESKGTYSLLKLSTGFANI